MTQILFLFIAAAILTGCGNNSESSFDPIPEQNSTPISQASVDPSLLWRPVSSLRSDANLQLYNDNRKVSFANYDPWPVPEDPSWRENPHSNSTWQFYYQALIWLHIPMYGYEKTGEEKYINDVKTYIFDWISDNQIPDSTMAWYDHSVAYRSAIFSYVYHKYLGDYLSDSEKETFFDSVIKNGEVLFDLIHDPKFIAHNHNMFHSIALFNLSMAFPDLPKSQEWKIASRERMIQLMGEMVYASEGVSVEQAIGYHWVAISLFHEANTALSNFNFGFENAEMDILHKMVDFAALMRYPNGQRPAIGNTSFGNSLNTDWFLSRYFNLGYGTEITSFFVNDSGEEPDDINFYPESGFLVFRPSYQSDLAAFVDMGPNRQSHGHNDAMNFLLYDYDTPMIIDPGGPYNYQDALKRYFVSASAHNTVVVNHQDYGSGDVDIKRVLDAPEFSFIEGVHEKYDGFTHKRSIFLIKSGLFLIFDQLASDLDTDNSYDLLYHFPPGSSVQVLDPKNLRMFAENGAGLALSVQSSAELSTEILEGQETPSPQGWVTTGYGKKVPAPVAQFGQNSRDAWFVTAIKPFPATGSIDISVTASEVGGDWTFTIHEPSRSLSIALPATGDPEVATSIH